MNEIIANQAVLGATVRRVDAAKPIEDAEAFLLDMATTTVAGGKIRNKANEGLPTPEGSRHKGYGLARKAGVSAASLLR